MTPLELLMLAETTSCLPASLMSVGIGDGLDVFVGKERGDDQDPRMNARIAIIMIRRRAWGAMGRSPPGRNFLIPFGFVRCVGHVSNLEVVGHKSTAPVQNLELKALRL